MRELEAGAIANPTEKRMVGHYWLRDPALAPTPELRTEIEETIKPHQKVRRRCSCRKNHGRKWKTLRACAPDRDRRLRAWTAIDGRRAWVGAVIQWTSFSSIIRTRTDSIASSTGLDDLLPQTLVIVISKSGGTKETRNGMLEAEARFKEKTCQFNKHAVAVTGVGSDLDKYAEENEWLARFPMYDWIGGRTSVMSAVGLLPWRWKASTSTVFSRARRRWTNGPASPDVTQNAAMLLALDVVPRRQRQRRQRHGDPSLQGPAGACSPNICSNS